MVASSSKIKFWSAAPPRTLNPAAPSPPLDTPGRRVIALMTSASPNTTGICLILEAVNELTLICGLFIFKASTLLSMITSSKLSITSVRVKSIEMF